MSFYRQDDCDGWKWNKVSKFEPSEPCQETDILGGVWIYKSDETKESETGKSK